MVQNVSQLAQQTAILLRENSQGGNLWADALRNAGESLGIQARSTHLLALGNPAIYLQSFATTLAFASPPHNGSAIFSRGSNGSEVAKGFLDMDPQ